MCMTPVPNHRTEVLCNSCTTVLTTADGRTLQQYNDDADDGLVRHTSFPLADLLVWGLTFWMLVESTPMMT